MRNRKLQIGEGRRLTAAWLNIIAAGIASAGTVPLLATFALEGWDSRARTLLLLPCFAFALSAALHLVGRITVREKALLGQGVRRGFRFVMCCGEAPEPGQSAREQARRFPSESDVDAVLEEFGNDPREAIRALLCDLDALADDSDTVATRVPSARRRSALHVRY
jgi:hypothetical protein